MTLCFVITFANKFEVSYTKTCLKNGFVTAEEPTLAQASHKHSMQKIFGPKRASRKECTPSSKAGNALVTP